jgi:hypothetical protein
LLLGENIMPELPERQYVKIRLNGIGFTVPVEELAYYKRAGALEEGEERTEANMTPAEKRMAQIARGEEPTNQVSSLALENADLPATSEEIAVTVNYGPVGSGVTGPAASAEAEEDADATPKKAATKRTSKKAGE